MTALRKSAAEPGLRLEEIPVPVPAADEVLVEVETASVCGTDLHIYGWDEWSQGRIKPPLTLGHEFAGTVVETRRARPATSQVGDYVSAESHVTCGMCFQCRTGHAHMCERTRILGVDRDGAFARYVAVPEAVIWRNDRAKLPPEIATLQEPFGNAVFATSEQDLAGRSVAVLGCGPIGLFTIGIARGVGRRGRDGRRPHAVPARPRREDGRERRGQRRRDAGRRSAWFLEQNDGYGFDVVFEMSGSPRAIADAFRIARNGGRVILFGIPSRPVEIDVAESLIFKNLNVLALNGAQDLRDLVPDALAAGERRRRPPAADHEGAAARGVRGGVRAALGWGGVQDRRLPRRAARRRRRARGAGARARPARGPVAAPMTPSWIHGCAPSWTRCARPAPTSGSTRSARRRGRWSRWRAAARCSSSRRTTTSGLADRPEVVEAGIEGLRKLRRRAPPRCASSAGRSSRTSSWSASSPTLVGTEASLTYVSCWNANEAAIPSLTDENTVILSDELNHAVDHRRGAAREARAEGGLQALRHGRRSASSSSRSSRDSARS